MTNLDTSAWNDPTPNANPPLMAPRPRLLGSGGGITVTEAIRHYLHGNGSPITLPFSVVDTSSATPIKFDCVRSFVSSCHEPGDYHVVGTNSFPAVGKPRLVLGDVPVKLDGTITYTGQCNWTFHGTMTGAEDPYDFNAGNRGLLGEALTALGRALYDGRGTPYVFQFSGSVPLDGSGHCGDRQNNMSENPIDGLRIDQLGAETQRQLASIILAAVKRVKLGSGRPSDPYVKKDRAFVAKELVYLHFKRELPWKKSIQFLRTRSDYKAKMSGIKDESWIIYALDFREKHM